MSTRLRRLNHRSFNGAQFRGTTRLRQRVRAKDEHGGSKDGPGDRAEMKLDKMFDDQKEKAENFVQNAKQTIMEGESWRNSGCEL